MIWDANLLNRIGLVLGIVSGLLLIPEVFNRLPLDRIEKSIENFLPKVEGGAKFPTRFHPPSWKFFFKERDRQDIIEPMTAFLGLLFSIAWISGLYIGIRANSSFFITFSLFLPLHSIFQNILKNWDGPIAKQRLGRLVLVFISFGSIFLLAPLTSFFRVILFSARLIVRTLQPYFSKYNVLKTTLTIFAILAFIASNVLQFLATFY